MPDCVAAADRVLDTPDAQVTELCPHLAVLRDLAERWRALISERHWPVFVASWRGYLATVVHGYQPDPAEWDGARLAAVRHAVGLVTGIDNDLASPGADEANAQLVDVLAAEQHVDPESAVRETVALRNLPGCAGWSTPSATSDA